MFLSVLNFTNKTVDLPRAASLLCLILVQQYSLKWRMKASILYKLKNVDSKRCHWSREAREMKYYGRKTEKGRTS